MRVLGIDTGSRVTGYGVIETDGADCIFVDCGVIRVKPSDTLPLRLKAIHEKVISVIQEWKPDQAAFESVFHSTNVQSALKLGHARGVCIHAAAASDVPVFEYSPAEVKSAVTGYGRAEKPQVQQMVRALLNLADWPEPYDASDALAVAICHAHTYQHKKALAAGGRQ
ncbi:MAG TPA: crossover junction endodeoxyribonuclease RuvC [Terriglobia bacterium]|nr:crossover junction endodeoxyribonuclease RuvC [Terriglobia bacterium]